MDNGSDFHVVTVGMTTGLVEDLWKPIASESEHRFSHILHPRHMSQNVPARFAGSDFHWFRQGLEQSLPEPDHDLLASLEREGVPTIHNIILGDRVVAALKYEDSLRYVTFLARRLIELFTELRPSVVIASFDAVHSGVSLTVARRMGIPWYAMSFSVIPPGLACFCDRLTPAARVQLAPPALLELRAFAEASLAKFEGRSLKVPAWLPPPPPSLLAQVARLPARMRAVVRTIRRGHTRDVLQYTEHPSDYSVTAAVAQLRRSRAARKAVARIDTLEQPPATPYVLFGLHTQPEASIDVCAAFFSNQMWVIELFARAIPPSHKLLVKIHKSDDANYSERQLREMKSFPGVEIIRPFADSRAFVDKAALIVSIQGTMGLEGGLLGKPVIMLAESPATLFPSVSKIGQLDELPSLVKRKLAESPPSRSEILKSYVAYLSPFMPTAHNDWRIKKNAGEITDFGRFFDALKKHVADRSQSQLEHRSIN